MSAGDTGEVPSANGNNANFEDVAVPNANSEGNLATSDVVSAAPFATAEPDTVVNANADANANANANADAAPATTMSKKGKPMSVKQADLQRLRSETLADMRAKYAERFADYPKPPKAKAYHAAGLTTIRQRNGESAYNAALNKIMNANNAKKGNSGVSALTASRKAKKASIVLRNNTTKKTVYPKTVLNASVNVAANNSAKRIITSSIEDMGRTAKGLIDTIVKASKSLSQEVAKTGRTSTLKQMSKTLKNSSMNTTKKNARPLKTVYENNSNNGPLGSNSPPTNNWSSALNSAVANTARDETYNNMPPGIPAVTPESKEVSL